MTRVELIASLNPRSGAEVGTLVGDFAAALLTIQSLEYLYVIDAWTHFPGEYERDPANVDQGGQDARERAVRRRFLKEWRVEVVKGMSVEVARSFNENSLDFVFLDAQHAANAVFDDLVSWSRVSNVLLVHDYIDTDETRRMGFDVMKGVADFCRIHDWKILTITDEEWPTAMIVPR